MATQTIQIAESINPEQLNQKYTNASPFPHIVIDNFFPLEIAQALSDSFPDYNDPLWHSYSNAIENKKTTNIWNNFPALVYQAMSYFNSQTFLSFLEKLTGINNLLADHGLNGGGLHVSQRGGKLNIHLDYSIHPKIKIERRLNLLVYLTEDWNPAWGGALELWSHDPIRNKPKEKVQSIDCIFNRAVLFDTGSTSWHGLPQPLTCPEDVLRKSLAVYYMTEPRTGASARGKALFTPNKEQEADQEVLELIKLRSDTDTAELVYR